MTAWTVDRRDLLAQLLILIGAPVTAASLAACTSRSQLPPEGSGRFFDASAMAMLTDVVDLMIPRTTTIGAVGAGVPGFIDGLMTQWAGPTARTQIGGVLADIDAAARTRSNTHYAALEQAGRLAVLTAVDARSFAGATPPDLAYRLFKQLVFLAYATSEQVDRGYVPNPGTYRGDLTRGDYDKLVAERSVAAS